MLLCARFGEASLIPSHAKRSLIAALLVPPLAEEREGVDREGCACALLELLHRAQAREGRSFERGSNTTPSLAALAACAFVRMFTADGPGGASSNGLVRRLCKQGMLEMVAEQICMASGCSAVSSD